VPAALKPAPLAAWRELAPLHGIAVGMVLAEMPPVIALGSGRPPLGYRRVGRQGLRIDMAEKLLREAYGRRATGGTGGAAKGLFTIDPALARSMGLALESHVQLLRTAGFLAYTPPPLADGMFGPPAPTGWRWRPPRRQASPPAPARTPESPGGGGAFAALAGLVR